MENQVSEIITLLRDDNEYYNGYGKNYLSNSDIGILRSMMRFTRPAIFTRLRQLLRFKV
jgi:hypothetical protein